MTSGTLKATTGHDVEKCPALREFHDRFRQVGVCAPVAGDPATDDREDTPEIKLIQLFHGEMLRHGKFQNNDLAPRAQNPIHLTQSLFQMLKVAHPESHRYRIKGIVTKLHRFGVPAPQVNLTCQADFRHLLAPDVHHVGRNVNACHLPHPGTACRNGEIPRPARHVQQMPLSIFLHTTHRLTPPPLIDVQGEKMVQ